MRQQIQSHSMWGEVSSSTDFPLFIRWLRDEQIPAIEQSILALDELDKKLKKRYIGLKGELRALTGIVIKYETKLGE